MNKSIGINELIERTIKSVKEKDKELSKQLPGAWKSFVASGKVLVKVIEEHFFLVIKDALNKGEEVAIKNFFTISRQTTKSKGSKRCDKHEREIEGFRRTNKGKGIQAYAKSEVFKKIVRDTRNCSSCKAKKQQIAKLAKPTTRVTFKTSKNFWTVSKTVRKGK
ncbi:hypothetical protein [endosymbiont GvMRE of Glomus versiforme]|uniref:hypothetical protein n=1 Tax=endosymbiont GvMRE of Glomus versiforme TaxID=2039283 RepID=UPI000EB8C00B|nr:hypothetical protein [endosymbiont GvMRE of Glomus versiforme]RHZ36263.1 hypothetical protein GvMRE_Ic1g34 [endosymbiont GvMRE of Glomus versiforme]